MDQKDGNFDTSELGNKIKAYIQSVNALTNNKKSMVDDMKKFESKKVQVLLGGVVVLVVQRLETTTISRRISEKKLTME